jgi:hypothetical protein
MLPAINQQHKAPRRMAACDARRRSRTSALSSASANLTQPPVAPLMRAAAMRGMIARMEQRLAIARILACQMLARRGEAATDEAIEREAATIAKGLYVERPEDEVALTVKALIGAYVEAPPDRLVDENNRSINEG